MVSHQRVIALQDNRKGKGKVFQGFQQGIQNYRPPRFPPCTHCGQTNHSSDRCWYKDQSAQVVSMVHDIFNDASYWSNEWNSNDEGFHDDWDHEWTSYPQYQEDQGELSFGIHRGIETIMTNLGQVIGVIGNMNGKILNKINNLKVHINLYRASLFPILSQPIQGQQRLYQQVKMLSSRLER